MHARVAIVGLDRLSTSFGLALKRYEKQPKADHSFTIIGNDPKIAPMKAAKNLGAVDDFDRAVLKAVGNADLVLINAPYGVIKELYEAIGPELKPGAVVLDFSLLKQPVVGWADQYFPKNSRGVPLVYLVGITPVINVAGLYSGETDAEFARADLFDGAEILLTPDAKTPSEAIELTEDVIRIVGGKSRFMDPAEHDGLVAMTEELPMLVGASLFYLLNRSEGWMELRRMVNPTFALAISSLRSHSLRDLTALFTQNKANLLRNLETLIGLLDQVHDTLADDPDGNNTEAFLAAVMTEWEKWDIKRHSGEWEEVQQVELLPGPLGSVSGFLNLARRGKKDEADEDEEE